MSRYTTYLAEIEPGLVKVGRTEKEFNRMLGIRAKRALWVSGNCEKDGIRAMHGAGFETAKGREYFRAAWESACRVFENMLREFCMDYAVPIGVRAWDKKAGEGESVRIFAAPPQRLSELELKEFEQLAAGMNQSVDDMVVRLIRRELLLMSRDGYRCYYKTSYNLENDLFARWCRSDSWPRLY